jgi:heme-degrading monooxygenase HmoA
VARAGETAALRGYESTRRERIFRPLWQQKLCGENKMPISGNPAWGFVAVWEFRPKAGAESRFESAYGALGIWAKFFTAGEGFVATELNRDLKDLGRYFTLDFWVSHADYEAFRTEHAEEYRNIDRQCEDLTAEEKLVGYFERLP